MKPGSHYDTPFAKKLRQIHDELGFTWNQMSFLFVFALDLVEVFRKCKTWAHTLVFSKIPGL